MSFAHDPTQEQADLLLALTGAASKQEVLHQLLLRISGLKSVTLWWQDEGMMLPHCGVGVPLEEDPPTPLPYEPRYLLGLTSGVTLPETVQAVLALKLLHLDVQDINLTLNRQLSALTKAATTDALTGLPNRRAFDADLDALDLTDSRFAVAFIDLDGFKAINDQFGHALGDSLLRGYGVWLSRVTKGLGQVYRMGGDEYLVLITNFPGQPEEFAAWAHERLQIPFVDGVTASIGIAWRHESPAVSDVVRLADQRMYQAKAERPLPPANAS
ncbi:hypothetical protein DKM44_04150 [Deinococcus irradiatisoli]|uniref:GGDEF domain-containing protein n=1 Tax=Deinococcus irradiatisoli TaxID=2202254 RepID=A0A2Z3JBK2_9DEIO|nr:GGDEF domain-containing protein [Deinococcus irradiatisoli]AWN22527.1 hypothetical protein DKM44_04150 [Deinococcus irradiatisoli]